MLPARTEMNTVGPRSELLETRLLSNGLELRFFDSSNRYFGDYHRVCIELRCEIEVRADLLEQCRKEDPEVNLRVGQTLLFSKRFERMGVAGQELEQRRREIIDSFLEGAGKYLESPRFILNFALKQAAE